MGCQPPSDESRPPCREPPTRSAPRERCPATCSEDFEGVSGVHRPCRDDDPRVLADEAELHGLLDALSRGRASLVDVRREAFDDWEDAPPGADPADHPKATPRPSLLPRSRRVRSASTPYTPAATQPVREMTMTTSRGGAAVHDARTRSVVDQFLEAKLHRPRRRDSWVQRDRLVDALDRAVRHPVTLVAAPPATARPPRWPSGSTSDRPPATAWVSLDPGDNDPDRLWTHVAAALERAGASCPSASHRAWSVAPAATTPGRLLPALLNALAAVPDDIVLVLDDFHFVQSPGLPRAGPVPDREPARAGPPGHRHPLRPRSAAGAAPRLERPGRDPGRRPELHLGRGDRAARQRRRAPARRDRLAADGAHRGLAGRPLPGHPVPGRPADPDEFVRRFSGGNRFIGDYLTEEVLSRHPDRVREFIPTASILDRFSASLCDHVLDATDSAAILHDLERSNLFVVPLDETREWFRFHHLFAAVARSELELAHPDHVRTLHAARRVVRVPRPHDEAVQHLLAAGRTEDAAASSRPTG